MSKRAAGANFGSGEERYGGELAHTMDNEKPSQATAAQMARRKIAQARRPGANRARSGSPAVAQNNAGSMQGSLFGNSNPPQQQTQNAFQSSNFSFTFGGPPQQQESSASPAPFQFGSSAPPPSTNGNGNMFGSTTPSFGGSFNAGSTQPQQNGFNPSTASIFNNQPSQSTNTNTNTDSFSFNQTQQSQQNGFTPVSTTSSVFGSFGKPQENTQTKPPSFSFGSTQQEKDKASTPFGGFGVSQQDKEKLSTQFGASGAGQQEREKSNTPFSGFGGGQPEKESSEPVNAFAGFGASQQNSQDPKPIAQFGVFGQGQQENTSKSGGLFAGISQKAQHDGESQTNLFGGFGQKKPDSTDVPSASSFSGFDQQKPLLQQPNGDGAKAPEKEITANSFSGFSQPQVNGEQSSAENTRKSTPFSFNQSSTPQPEKPSTSNIFSGFPQSTKPNGENKGLFGSSLLPTSTSTGSESIFSNLPKKDLSNGGKPLFDSSDPSQIYREEDDQEYNNETNPGNGSTFGQSSLSAGSLFKSTGEQMQSSSNSLFQKPSNAESDVSMATPGHTPQKVLFPATTQSGTPIAGPGNESTMPAPARSLFDRVDKDDVAKRLGGSTSSNGSTEIPKAHPFSAAPATLATVKPGTQAPAPVATPSAGSLFKPAQPSQLAQSQTATAASPRNVFDQIDKPMPQASTPFTPAPPTAPAQPWNVPANAPPTRTTAALSQDSGASTFSQSKGVLSMVNLTDPQKARIKDLNQGILGILQSENIEKDWTVIFDYYATAAAEIRGLPPPTPHAPSANTVTASDTRTASQSASVSNLFSKPSALTSTTTSASGNLFSQPSSLQNAAAKKHAFQEDDDEPAQAPNTEKRRKLNDEPINYPKLPEHASSTARLFEAAIDSPKSTTAPGFIPATKSLFSTSISQTSPAAAAISATSTGGFKPSLGSQQGGGSSFLSAFGNKAQQQQEKDRKKRKDEDYDSDEETEEQWEKRDRQGQEAKRKKFEEAAKSAKGFVLSGIPTATGDSTPKTPLKFGVTTTDITSTTPAVPPPKFNNLFGSTKAATSEPGKLAPPSTGFNFGPKPASTDASRATTPGVTTDGEASTAVDGDYDEPSDEQRPQSDADDHTALQSSEREASEVLLELQNTMIKTYGQTEKSDKPVWTGVGSGRLYVLKDKATGKTRLLNKVGVGRTALNFTTMKGMKYEKHPKKETIVIAPFMDHLHSTTPKFERFYITTETVSEATELAKILTEGVPQ